MEGVTVEHILQELNVQVMSACVPWMKGIPPTSLMVLVSIQSYTANSWAPMMNIKKWKVIYELRNKVFVIILHTIMACSLKNYLHYYLGSSSVRLSIMNWFGHQQNTTVVLFGLVDVLELFLCAIMVILCKWQRRSQLLPCGTH